MTLITTRFAPSTNGFLHLGHAYAARFAADHGQRFLLRIEDTDLTRCKPEFEAAVFEDMAWLGFEWEQPVWRQSDRFGIYQKALDKLKAWGLVYPCFCSRKQVLAEIEALHDAPHHGIDGILYPGTCRHLSKDEQQARISASEQHVWRLDMSKALEGLTRPLTWIDQQEGLVQAKPERAGDFVLARLGTPTSYHLAVTIDDAAQEVGLVTRATDLRDATDLHCLLQALLDLPTPNYRFHGLLTDAQGKRFAKRDKSVTIRDLRGDGWSPEQIWREISKLAVAIS